MKLANRGLVKSLGAIRSGLQKENPLHQRNLNPFQHRRPALNSN
jgi:hypothetical protein